MRVRWVVYHQERTTLSKRNAEAVSGHAAIKALGLRGKNAVAVGKLSILTNTPKYLITK